MAKAGPEWDDRYRMLREGEIIEADDEVLIDSRGWIKGNERCVGTPAPSPNYTSHRWYRRLKSKESPTHD